MLNEKVQQYFLIISILAVSTFIGNRFMQTFKEDDDYETIKKYLLNDAPLQGFSRPKIWVHSKYEINARNWKSFQSRNTTDLNQPYLHLTIKTIINHCGKDFNICLIDDQSFSKLLPSWEIDLVTMAEPMRTHYREIGMLKLLECYGGMILPNSFVCLRNLKEFYETGIQNEKPFVCENVNRHINNSMRNKNLLFTPDTIIMGSKKNSTAIKELIEYLNSAYKTPHFSNESDFIGIKNEWCINAINLNKINFINGKMVGVKNENNKPILIEDLLGENYIKLSTTAVGVYIPSEEILRRPKYQWFAVLSEEEILKSNLIISKYMQSSIVETTGEYGKKNGEIASVTSI